MTYYLKRTIFIVGNNEKRRMKKQELIQAVEKAKGQTRCEAFRVLDLLSGVRGDPLAKNRRAKREPVKRPSSREDNELQDNG